MAELLRFMDSPGRGVINIINNFKFRDSRNNFSDATGKADKDHLVQAFTKLNYRINYYENTTEKEIDQIFLDIKQDERLKTTNVILFYMLSHGSDTYTFLSSDEKDIDLHEKMLLFRRDNCPEMAYKPQLWFGDFCRGRDEQKIRKSINKDANAGSSNKIAKATRDVFSHTQYIMSSSPGIMSLADGKGSCFTSTFCEMLNEGKHQLDSSWNLELTERLKRNGNPTTTRYTHDPFPGEMFASQEFDFCYDTSKINWKVVENLK